MRVIVLQGFFYSIQAKFQVSGFSAPTFPLDHPPRNQQENRALLQRDGGSVAGGVREQTQGQAGWAEFSSPAAVAHQARRMSRGGAPEGARLFVVAAKESGA